MLNRNLVFKQCSIIKIEVISFVYIHETPIKTYSDAFRLLAQHLLSKVVKYFNHVINFWMNIVAVYHKVTACNKHKIPAENFFFFFKENSLHSLIFQNKREDLQVYQNRTVLGNLILNTGILSGFERNPNNLFLSVCDHYLTKIPLKDISTDKPWQIGDFLLIAKSSPLVRETTTSSDHMLHKRLKSKYLHGLLGMACWSLFQFSEKGLSCQISDQKEPAKEKSKA